MKFIQCALFSCLIFNNSSFSSQDASCRSNMFNWTTALGVFYGIGHFGAGLEVCYKKYHELQKLKRDVSNMSKSILKDQLKLDQYVYSARKTRKITDAFLSISSIPKECKEKIRQACIYQDYSKVKNGVRKTLDADLLAQYQRAQIKIRNAHPLTLNFSKQQSIIKNKHLTDPLLAGALTVGTLMFVRSKISV